MGKLGAISTIYLGGLLIGLNVVSFPSSSAYLIQELGFSDQQYGSIYLPQLVLAIIGALGGGAVINAMGLKPMYLIALLCFALSQGLFAVSVTLPAETALILIMAATALFGFGFGFGGGPLNGIAAALFPKHSNSALTALHTSAGLGMMAGPLVFANAISAQNWIMAPSVLAVVGAVLLLVALVSRLPSPAPQEEEVAGNSPSKSIYFWMIMLVAVFYALAEGTFANWAIIYVQDGKGLDAGTAATALASFWGALTIGRLIATFVLVKVPAIVTWLCLPPLMIAAFLIMPTVSGETHTILAFAFAGFACSAFFPLMVSVASEPYPHALSYIASMLTAALMFGVGIGSYVIGAFAGSISLDRLYMFSAAYPAIALVLILIARRFANRKVS